MGVALQENLEWDRDVRNRITAGLGGQAKFWVGCGRPAYGPISSTCTSGLSSTHRSTFISMPRRCWESSWILSKISRRLNLSLTGVAFAGRSAWALPLSPNPPMDSDGRGEDSGRG